MSYGLGPFAVKLARVERVFGCRDVALADAILREEAVDDDVDEAVRDIIEGRAFRDGPDDGPLYGRALRVLCRHFGRELPTEYFLYDDLVGAVDEALGRSGIPEETFSVARRLMYRGSPVAIPTPDNFPYIGYLRAHEIGRALRAVGTVDLAALEDEVRGAVAELRSWLETCSTAACDLVCFYS